MSIVPGASSAHITAGPIWPNASHFASAGFSSSSPTEIATVCAWGDDACSDTCVRYTEDCDSRWESWHQSNVLKTWTNLTLTGTSNFVSTSYEISASVWTKWVWRSNEWFTITSVSHHWTTLSDSSSPFLAYDTVPIETDGAPTATLTSVYPETS